MFFQVNKKNANTFPSGILIIALRSFAEALIWFGASKWRSGFRYVFSLELNTKQISGPRFSNLSMKLPPNFDRRSLPFLS